MESISHAGTALMEPTTLKIAFTGAGEMIVIAPKAIARTKKLTAFSKLQ
jgi:hypothetical protein